MKIADKPIGVFDSGVGGLTVLRKLAELMPNEDLVYLGDTARVPYGNKSPEMISMYAQQCTRFLVDKSVKFIVIACNTVSAVALNEISAISPVPVIGMINPGSAAAIHKSPNGKIGIIGTQATIHSKAYEFELRRLAAHDHLNIHTQACPLFVPLAEEGWELHPAAQLIVHEYLAPLKEAGIESLILGCTHYPVLKPIIADYMSDVILIDSGEEAAIVTKQLLNAQGKAQLNKNQRNIEFYVTDISPVFSLLAHRLCKFTIKNVQQVAIDSLTNNKYQEYHISNEG